MRKVGMRGVADSISSGDIPFNFDLFLLASRSSKLGEIHTNEIKHDIHPEQWVNEDRYNIKNITALKDRRM